MIKSSSIALQDKAQAELKKLDKELEAKIDESAKAIEKSKMNQFLKFKNKFMT